MWVVPRIGSPPQQGTLMRRLLALALLTASPVFAQSSALQAGRAQPITAQERQQGAQANPSLTAEYGGALTGRQAAYVESIGRRIATQSGLSNSPGAFNVTLLNSPIDNAFAIPGGYVYVTRNLVALMNDEAELAAVMGHEVAHVAARHSRQRQSRAQRNVLGGAEPDLTGALQHVFARDRAARVHLYGKTVVPGRKVGHVTCVGTDVDDVLRRARHAAGYLMGDPDA